MLKLREHYPNSHIAVMTRNPTVNTFPGVQYFAGDVSVPTDIDRIFSAVRPTVVFHCAAVMPVRVLST